MVTKIANRLERVFNPRTIAVVGDKQVSDYMWLRSNKTFTGKLYSVQIDENEIPGIEALGVPNYKSLMDVPDEIDYVIIAVPRQVAPRIVKDCIAKGVGGCTLFTSGFAETEEEEGIHLQRTLLEMASEANLALIGPNCMGLHVPKLGVRHSADQLHGPEASGEVGFISQSGTHAGFFTQSGPAHGIGISKSVSFGNAIILEAADYMEYMAGDPDTKAIGMYVEGARDGARFFRVLRETSKHKPVVIWKGGLTEAGHRAIYSHTASLASPAAIWNSMVRQAGGIPAEGTDDIIDTMKALLRTKPGTARGVALVAMTGGQSVAITDAFARAGLEVPRLTDASYAKLAEFFNTIGGSYQNPFDSAGTIGIGGQSNNLVRLLNIIDADPNIGAVAMELSVGFMARRWQEHPGMLDEMLDTLSAFRDRSSKPFVTILHPAHMEEAAIDVRKKVQARGLPTFASFDRGARALAKAIDYHRYRAGLS